MVVEVTIDSVRVSLMSQHRIVVLKEMRSNRYLPIWIGPFEADAITIELQNVEVSRPLTHDLLRSVIDQLNARVEHVTITDLRNDTFYAQIALNVDGRALPIDSRPSDAIALAVRTRVPIYVDEDVLEQAGIMPEPDMEEHDIVADEAGAEGADVPEAFRDFLEGLDLTGLE
jgi:hypothetical protein